MKWILSFCSALLSADTVNIVTTSGGENWVDIVVYNTSRVGLLAYNFAISGATVNHSRAGTDGQPTNKDMIAQQQTFSDSGRRVSWRGDNSLFIGWFGM